MSLKNCKWWDKFHLPVKKPEFSGFIHTLFGYYFLRINNPINKPKNAPIVEPIPAQHMRLGEDISACPGF
ncbi:unknown [[Mannheimia] succiniciproducens MBEL55E]|uniref:Uncharacterized protein n=1 Tax=Mannheimia succiniciproducens (strain KCTC 0769BP / MBEL55E) TaxID=221988 RepID=Q65U40_MANSM|nr:unknown [[Mannheimia] succiniciproducens MBEL55E]